MPGRRTIAGLVTMILLLIGLTPITAQTTTETVSLSVTAGYDTYFRENYWLPVQVRVQNTGSAIDGKLIVRPETSGRVVSNAYSTPVNLPTDSDQTAFLYLQARAFPPQFIVELVDNEGVRIAEQRVIISPLNPNDLLHVVVSGGNQTLALNDVRAGGFTARQAQWNITNLPDNVNGLKAIDTLWLMNVDTNNLTIGQRDAIEQFVVDGGHLIVIGGPAWQDTTAGIVDLLPLTPSATVGVDDLSALARRIGDRESQLDERTLVTTGQLNDTAQILAATEDDVPVIVRGDYGLGRVDFVLVDPTLEPLRSWDNLSALWFMLAADVDPHPSWSDGFMNPNEAAAAIAILPGVDLLPPASSMVLFLAAYILLIGPVNYLVLSRLNRRNWAWVTIPLFIGVFTALAWTVGFNLRGNDVILSRLTVVRSYPAQAEAVQDQLLGILSPRRATYSLQVDEGQHLRVMPEIERAGGFLSQNLTQSTAEIIQTTQFSAEQVAIDGGIFANFSVSGATDALDISGALTLAYNPNNTQSLRGVIRNDSADLTLNDPVILARGVAYHLNDPIAPGDLVTVDEDDLTLAFGGNYPSPSPVELSRQFSGFDNVSARNIATVRRSEVTINDILGDPDERRAQISTDPESVAAQTMLRRDALLKAFMRDQFGDTGRGHQAYLIGWSESAWESAVDITDTPYTPIDTTLFIIALDVTVDQPEADQTVTIRPGQFTWVATDRSAIDIGGANDLLLIAESSIEFQFMPISDAVLDDVTEMTVHMDRTASYGRDVILSLWDWDTDTWVPLTPNSTETYTLTDPAQFLGADNTVRMQLFLNSTLGSARISELYITQTGTFRG